MGKDCAAGTICGLQMWEALLFTSVQNKTRQSPNENKTFCNSSVPGSFSAEASPSCGHLPAGGDCTAQGSPITMYKPPTSCPNLNVLPDPWRLTGAGGGGGRSSAGREPLAHCEALNLSLKLLFPNLEGEGAGFSDLEGSPLC